MDLDDYYYSHLYKNRLAWTKLYIPIRVLDERSGVFVEAYLQVVSPIKDINEQRVEVKLAFLPLKVNDTIFVKLCDIYSTARNLTLIKDKETVEIEKSQEFLPKEQLPINKLYKIFQTYTGCAFTVKELEAMLNNTLTMSQIQDLKEKGTKRCLITGEESEAYDGFSGKRIVLSADKTTLPTTLTKLLERYQDCTGCELGVARKTRGMQITPGRNAAVNWSEALTTNAPIMFIGEAPGVVEESTQFAFNTNAPAGSALYKVISAAKIDHKDCYYTNAVLCRPESSDSKTQNGKPTPEHITMCNTRLKNELAIVKPRLIVLLGKVAYRAFFGKDPISVINASGWADDHKRVYFAPHPSYVIRELSFAQPAKATEVKNLYLSHFVKIKERFDELKN